MTTIRELASKFNIESILRQNEPLSRHTTFRIGGPADYFVTPSTEAQALAALKLAREAGLSPFILGGGANILVSDYGVRGLVIDMTAVADITVEGCDLVAGAGAPISEAAAAAADAGLGGLDFLYAMPGSTGGAVWMNARCYGSSVVDVLSAVRYIDEDLEVRDYLPRPQDFDYKVSPFQGGRRLIVSARFGLQREDPQLIRERMRHNESDRRAKGHFDAPSAGSVFKNNRNFGEPTGKIIDSLGLRGYSVGRAKISDNHANIFVNTGGASASDMRSLIELVATEVREKLGLELEREVLYAGDWREEEIATHAEVS